MWAVGLGNIPKGGGSPVEVEIRACTVQAVEIVCSLLAKRMVMTIRERDF